MIPLGKKRKGFVSGFVSVSDSVATVYLMVAKEVVSFNLSLNTHTYYLWTETSRARGKIT